MYLFHISLHGLVRSHSVELGRDNDTGGQITYILNLLSALSQDPFVQRVELATRGFLDPAYDADYGLPSEKINDTLNIVRFFDKDARSYLPKESLWSRLPQLKERMLEYLRAQPALPDIIHAHYADAGLLGAQIAGELGIPFLFTGHSLGRTKQASFLEQGITPDEMEEKFNISKRIAAEEQVLAAADAIIASTRHEVEEQYQLYEQFVAKKTIQLPPGFDPSVVKAEGSVICPQLLGSINRFLKTPNKPPILAMARADYKKNLPALVEAFGKDAQLRKLANLVIFAGQREDIMECNEEAQKVFQELLYLIDKYDLYGQVALPKHHQRSQVADIYGYAASMRGVFVNVALQEPFGLTLIEAAANGLPVVATQNGGAGEIIAKCRHGVCVDPTSSEQIGENMKQLLTDSALWERYAQNGLQQVSQYTWHTHARRYLDLVRRFTQPRIELKPPRWMITSDIDNTLTGDHRGVRELHNLLEEMRPHMLFAVATGRSFKSTLEVIEKWKLPQPKALLTSVGSEIYYAGEGYTKDWRWHRMLGRQWDWHSIAQALAICPELHMQASEDQHTYKLSYYVEEGDVRLDLYQRLIHRLGLRANIIYSQGVYLDILPARASKAKAMNYLRQSMNIPKNRVIAVGDSGNDRDMLTHSSHGVVVANYHKDLTSLSGFPHIIFSGKPYAAGAVNGIRQIITANA